MLSLSHYNRRRRAKKLRETKLLITHTFFRADDPLVRYFTFALAPPRQKFQEVKHFFQEIFGESVSRETLRGARPKNYDPLFFSHRGFLLACQILQSVIKYSHQ